MSIKTVRQVEEGEEVTLSYVDLFLPKEERRMKVIYWVRRLRDDHLPSKETHSPPPARL